MNGIDMDRRDFIRKIGLVSAAAAFPASVKTFAGEVSDGMFPSDAKPSDRASGRAHGGLELRFRPYELKLRHSFNLARSSRVVTPGVQLEISIDGITGYGESSMPPYLGESVDSVMKFLGRVDLSQFNDPFRLDEIIGYVDSIAPDNNAAKAGVDIALHDLVGKIMGKPWYAIWGLLPERTPDTSFTIGIDKEEVVRTKVEEAAPYNILKVKMGLDKDRETIDVIRSMTQRPICVDVNQGWNSKETALEMCHWLAEKNCLFVEQPMPKEMIDDIAWLRERSPLPIIADESVKRLSDVAACSGVYDGINIKLMKSTGMREAHRMALLAKALGLKVMIGCMTETSCAVTAASHLSPMAEWADLDGNLLITNDCFEGMKIIDGKIVLPDAPGLGLVGKK